MGRHIICSYKIHKPFDCVVISALLLFCIFILPQKAFCASPDFRDVSSGSSSAPVSAISACERDYESKVLKDYSSGGKSNCATSFLDQKRVMDQKNAGGILLKFDGAAKQCSSSRPPSSGGKATTRLECQLQNNSAFSLGSPPQRVFADKACTVSDSDSVSDYYYLNNRLNNGTLVAAEGLAALNFMLGKPNLAGINCNDPDNPKLKEKCNQLGACPAGSTNRQAVASLIKPTYDAVNARNQIESKMNSECNRVTGVSKAGPIMKLDEACAANFRPLIAAVENQAPWIKGDTFKTMLLRAGGIGVISQGQMLETIEAQLNKNREALLQTFNDYTKAKQCIRTTDVRNMPAECNRSNYVRTIVDKSPPFDHQALLKMSSSGNDTRLAMINADCKYDVGAHQIAFDQGYNDLTTGIALTIVSAGAGSVVSGLKVTAAIARSAQAGVQVTRGQQLAGMTLLGADLYGLKKGYSDAVKAYQECSDKNGGVDSQLAKAAASGGIESNACPQINKGPTAVSKASECVVSAALATALKVLPLAAQYGSALRGAGAKTAEQLAEEARVVAAGGRTAAGSADDAERAAATTAERSRKPTGTFAEGLTEGLKTSAQAERAALESSFGPAGKRIADFAESNPALKGELDDLRTIVDSLPAGRKAKISAFLGGLSDDELAKRLEKFASKIKDGKNNSKFKEILAQLKSGVCKLK